jgi:hypothetical protein
MNELDAEVDGPVCASGLSLLLILCMIPRSPRVCGYHIREMYLVHRTKGVEASFHFNQSDIFESGSGVLKR